MSKPRELVIERSYAPDEGACVRALEILLKDKAAGRDGGEDDGKGETSVPSKRSIPARS